MVVGDRSTDIGDHGREARLTHRLGVEHPIIQTGMGWVAGASLTAATSAAGGFGILAGSTMDVQELMASLQRVKARTSKPFGVNFNVDLPDLESRLGVTIDQGVRVVSFAGPPTAQLVERLHREHVITIATVGARRHAEKVADLGVDIVIAQGGEGGGHTGSVPTSLLTPQVVDAVGGRVPVVAAGGICDGRGVAAALALGADGVAMGTRFLLTRESRVPDSVKRRYLATGVLDTVVTTAIDGRPQRVIRTPFVDRLENTNRLLGLLLALRSAKRFSRIGGHSLRELVTTGRSMHRTSLIPWTQVLTAANAPVLTRSVLVEGNEESGIFPSGQVVGLINDIPTVAELIDRLLSEAREARDRLVSVVI